MPMQLLLTDDVEALGNSGEIVTVRPGFARNYLLPKKKAVLATKQTLRLQERLRKERAERAAIDRKEAEELAESLKDTVLHIEVKVDPEGHMYGSVTANDIVKLFSERGLQVARRDIVLPQPIKDIGTHTLVLRLKEGVTLPFILQINSDQSAPSNV